MTDIPEFRNVEFGEETVVVSAARLNAVEALLARLAREGWPEPAAVDAYRKLNDENRALRALIQQIEWGASSCGYEHVPACPWCISEEPGPHYTTKAGFHLDCPAAELMGWKRAEA